MTPPPELALRLPEGTEKVAVTSLVPASTSAKLMPVSALATSSVTPIDAGAVMEGASLTLFRLTVIVAVSVRPPLSVTCTVRSKVGVVSRSSWPESRTVISPVSGSMSNAVAPVPPVIA